MISQEDFTISKETRGLLEVLQLFASNISVRNEEDMLINETYIPSAERKNTITDFEILHASLIYLYSVSHLRILRKSTPIPLNSMTLKRSRRSKSTEMRCSMLMLLIPPSYQMVLHVCEAWGLMFFLQKGPQVTFVNPSPTKVRR